VSEAYDDALLLISNKSCAYHDITNVSKDLRQIQYANRRYVNVARGCLPFKGKVVSAGSSCPPKPHHISLSSTVQLAVFALSSTACVLTKLLET